MPGSVLTGPWVHQLILQPPTPVLQVWLPGFEVCHDTVECNLGSECCEKSCLPKSWEKPAGASPVALGAMAQSCPCPQSSFGVSCKGVCALLWTWLWLILTWFPGLASDLAHPCGLTDLLAICCHCQTCSALLAWSLCLCPFSLLSLLPALLTFAPQAPQAPLQLLLCPAPGMDHRDFRMSETPGGNGQWCDRRDCYDNKENVALALLPFSFLNSQSEIQVYGHEPGCRESSRQEELAGHIAGSFPSTHRCRFQGHRFRSAFLGLSCRQTSSSRRQRKLLSIATEQPQWFILNSF